MAGYNNNVKNNLTAVFQDTLDFINEEEDLYDCIEYSKRESELIKADEYYDSSDVLAARLQQAILHLPAKQQLAFNLRYYDELSYDEIAEVAGSSAASAKMNYHLAKEKIIEYMNKND